MSDSLQLVKCPECNCSVRSDRLRRHRQKVHYQQKILVGRNKSVENVFNSLTIENFREMAKLVDSWLRVNHCSPYSPERVTLLAFVVLENSIGCGFNEINELFGNRIQKEKYEEHAKSIKVEYEAMVTQLYEELVSYREKLFDQEEAGRFDSVKNDSQSYASWAICNSVDRMDGSKYIGYRRREYDHSRFGSFPSHDDYGEESWADSNPWE